MKEWLSIPEAALLIGRNKTNVYAWIRSGRLHPRTGPAGTLEVRWADVQAVEFGMKRGRPPRTQ